ncbi:MAG: CoA transferase [Gammaproteobacteria bacterium]|nr:CoA transferase [Gammaproteobacteria bacterium]
MDSNDFFANARSDLDGPLHGVKVVEATTTWAGPMASCVLADLGADVVKVELPGGEVARRMPPLVPDSGLTVAHETVNRNKRNLTLDLRLPTGRAAFLKLIANADIFIENFRPGLLRDWGLGYDDLCKAKADLIYVSISGFGQFGTLSARAGYDPLAQAYSGWASLNGAPDGGPTKAPTYLGDDLAGLHGALGAMAALRHRDRTGEGQHVDVALVDCLVFQSDGFPTAGALGIPMQRWGNQFNLAAPSNSYACRDGSVYAGVLLDSHWQRLAARLGRPDLAALTTAERLRRRDEVDGLLADYCAARITAEVVAEFGELGLPATRINTYAELAKEEHVASRSMLTETELADGRSAPLAAPPVKFSRTPTRVRTRAARLGEHNEQVLAGLGLTPEEIAALADEVVGREGG